MHDKPHDGSARHHHRPIPSADRPLRPYGDNGFTFGDPAPRPFGGGIPGNYVERIDGVPDCDVLDYTRGPRPIPPVPARPMGMGPEPQDVYEEDIPFCDDCDCGCGCDCDCDCDCGQEACEGTKDSVSDALLRIRLACKALEEMVALVATETGAKLDVEFMSPYHGKALGEDGAEFSEWLLLLGGEVAFYDTYDALCKLWMSGPEAMHGFLTDVTATSETMRGLIDTMGSILSANRPDEGDDDGEDDEPDDDLPYGGIFIIEEVEESDEPDDDRCHRHRGHEHHHHHGHQGHHGHHHHHHHGHQGHHGHHHHHHHHHHDHHHGGSWHGEHRHHHRH